MLQPTDRQIVVAGAAAAIGTVAAIAWERDPRVSLGIIGTGLATGMVYALWQAHRARATSDPLWIGAKSPADHEDHAGVARRIVEVHPLPLGKPASVIENLSFQGKQPLTSLGETVLDIASKVAHAPSTLDVFARQQDERHGSLRVVGQGHSDAILETELALSRLRDDWSHADDIPPRVRSKVEGYHWMNLRTIAGEHRFDLDSLGDAISLLRSRCGANLREIWLNLSTLHGNLVGEGDLLYAVPDGQAILHSEVYPGIARALRLGGFQATLVGE